jgi:hypothetical protein
MGTTRKSNEKLLRGCGNMFTFPLMIGATGTLLVSSIVDKILLHYGKESLADSLRVMTHLGAVGYGAYYVVRLLVFSATHFL